MPQYVPNLPMKVSGIVVGSACLPRLASCKYLPSPSGLKYHRARVWCGALRLPITEVPNHASYVPLYDVYFSRPRCLEVSRSRPEVPTMFSIIRRVLGLGTDQNGEIRCDFTRLLPVRQRVGIYLRWVLPYRHYKVIWKGANALFLPLT